MGTLPGSPGALWGSSGGSGTAVTGVPLLTILNAALRIAGLLSRPGWTHSDDQYMELVAAVNRLLASWGCDGHKVFTTSISQFPLTSGQKIYSIGSGGDFDTPRPVFIRRANILFPTNPVVRRPVRVLDDDEWAKIEVQDVPGAPPYQLYYDGGFDTSGRGSIYLRFQPPPGYTLELYAWQALQSFVTKDDTAIFPPGYEEALTWNLGIAAAGLNPREAQLSAEAPDRASRSLLTLISLNSRSPKITCEPGLDQDSGPGYGWLDGGIA